MRDEINRFTNDWIEYGQKCLKAVLQRPRSINILVADDQLNVTLSKLLAFGLGPLFPIENIYSSKKIGREQCYQRIIDRYGKKNTFIVVADGQDNLDLANSVSRKFSLLAKRSEII